MWIDSIAETASSLLLILAGIVAVAGAALICLGWRSGRPGRASSGLLVLMCALAIALLAFRNYWS